MHWGCRPIVMFLINQADVVGSRRPGAPLVRWRGADLCEGGIGMQPTPPRMRVLRGVGRPRSLTVKGAQWAVSGEGSERDSEHQVSRNPRPLRVGG